MTNHVNFGVAKLKIQLSNHLGQVVEYEFPELSIAQSDDAIMITEAAGDEQFLLLQYKGILKKNPAGVDHYIRTGQLQPDGSIRW